MPALFVPCRLSLVPCTLYLVASRQDAAEPASYIKFVCQDAICQPFEDLSLGLRM